MRKRERGREREEEKEGGIKGERKEEKETLLNYAVQI